jgi:phosphopantothenoylcysteine decarboxylase/phosphopantothenate--cysteine ligase
LAADVPVLVVPAMHPHMWSDPATTSNVKLLRERGFHVLDPDVGALTSGDVGPGRFPDTATILETFSELTQVKSDFLGKRVLVTAGGTREPIDPVRFIGNQSSGKQGYAVALQALRRGAEVVLVSANSTISDIDGVRMIHVQTAAQMHSVVSEEFPQCDLLVMAAAVADARPAEVQRGKIKKNDFFSIELVENTDILKSITEKKTNQVVIAFAAETSHDRGAATEKMQSKGADILYLNDVSTGEIFNSETTFGEIFTKSGESYKVGKTTKDTLAQELLDHALHQLG